MPLVADPEEHSETSVVLQPAVRSDSVDPMQSEGLAPSVVRCGRSFVVGFVIPTRFVDSNRLP